MADSPILHEMRRRQSGRRRNRNSIPRWGWVVILCFLALIGGTILHIKGTIPSLIARLQRGNPPNSTQSPISDVVQDLPPIDSTLIRAHSLTIITRSKFLVNCAQSGFIYSHAEDYYLGCITASEEIQNKIRKIPADDPKIAEARSHLVEMAIGFESMIQCFEESELNDRKRYFRLPSKNKLTFSVSANSVIDHYKRLELVCPE